MLPPRVWRTTGLPPPLTGPRKWLREGLPVVLTSKSLLTLPPRVDASRSNAEFSATRRVTPPPEVARFTSLERGAAKLAAIVPPVVLPSTLPVTSLTVRAPPLLLTCTGPRKSFTATGPPEVAPSNDPAPPDTSIPPPLVF